MASWSASSLDNCILPTYERSCHFDWMQCFFHTLLPNYSVLLLCSFKWLPCSNPERVSICSEAGHKALIAQGRIQPALMPAGIKVVIFKPLLWDSEAEKFRRHWPEYCQVQSSIHLRWEFHFQRSLEAIAIQAGNEKYWHKQVPGMCSCTAPRAGLDGAYRFCRWTEALMDLHWAMGRVVCCRAFQQEWGETEMLVRRLFPGSCRAKVDMWT